MRTKKINLYSFLVSFISICLVIHSFFIFVNIFPAVRSPITSWQIGIRDSLFQRGNETQVNTYTTSFQETPAICSFPDGSFVIVWDSNGQDGDMQGVYAKIFDASGQNKTEEIQVNNYTTLIQQEPSIFGFPDGSFIVAWESVEQDGDAMGVFIKKFNSTGNNQTNDIQVNSYTASSQRLPSVSGFPDGSFVVTWYSFVSALGYWTCYFKLFNSTCYAQTNDIRVNYFPSAHAYDPFVYGFPDSSFVIAWENDVQDGDGLGVFVQIFNSTGHNQTNDIQVSSHTENDQSNPSITGFSDGSFGVAWEDFGHDGYEDGIYAKVFNSTGHNQTNDIQVNTFWLSDQEDPTISGFPDGYFVVAWESMGQESGRGIYTKLFDPMGVSLTGDVHVNDYTDSEQDEPAVGTLTNKSFIVSWSSYNQDGDLDGVFCKILMDGIPLSNKPDQLITTRYGNETIDWALIDDVGPGSYRVWANDTNGNPYVWRNWSSWQNNTNLEIPVNRTDPGFFNYTIEFYDAWYQFGNYSTVYVTILDNFPESNSPSDISTLIDSSVEVTWRLTDDWGEGFYRIWSNFSSTFENITNWLQWSNSSDIPISINTESAGIMHYQIEFNDSAGQLTSDDVYIYITQPNDPPPLPIPGFEIFFVLIGLIGIISIMVFLSKRSKSSLNIRSLMN